ncbi:membrane-spanning 4-domains subfamily A member 8-like [Rana temporaria]|uniref:membrane-spanning 4-domains subfamily A member 8-like n=1 Tax=Rana temporaria TaxID=8407 RepID=UPI001AADB0F6|nr:membrane-spanning 4-domains subfamily A member 8-like [Rana temporaria]
MDFLVSPPCGPVFGVQQKHNILPVVPCNQEFYKIFLKGHLKVLGAVQITLVLLHWSLGAVLSSSSSEDLISRTANSGIPYWASVVYLVSGGLCVTVEIKPSLTLIKWTFAFSAICCLMSLIEFCLICVDLNNLNGGYSCPPWHPCWDGDYVAKLHRIALAFLFIACLGQLGMFIYLLFIGKKALSAKEDYTPEVFAVNNEYKYFISCEMSQPANENQNYIPLTPNSKTSDVKI